MAKTNSTQSREVLGALIAPAGLETFSLANRRYLGSKSKMLDVIFEKVTEQLGATPKTFLDAFAGSGVVAERFAARGSKVIANDLLLHNSIAHFTFLNHSEYNYLEACDIIAELGRLKPKKGYITSSFGNKYFSQENAMKLDAARTFIESQVSDIALQKVALTSLVYAADKVAQTVGHYDAFYNKTEVNKPLQFKAPNLVGTGTGNTVSTADANVVVSNCSVDVLYLDPPYNSRQYSDTYHVLENIVRWEKPEVFGVSRKFDRTALKSKYSTRAAFEAFSLLIESASAKLIVLSYSNTGLSRASRSNNVLSDKEIHAVLELVGETKVVDVDFKEFSVGKTSKREHKERLFICKVSDK